MKKFKLIFSLAMILALCVSASGTAYAADYSPKGLSGIVPGDTLIFSEDTAWATLTPVWGVRISFVADGEVISSEVVAEGEDAAICDAPAKSGYIFDGWGRTDDTAAVIVENSDTVTVVSGPGPIVMEAQYTRRTRNPRHDSDEDPVVPEDPEELPPAEDPDALPPAKEPLEIAEEEVPLSEAPAEEIAEIAEEEVPLADAPAEELEELEEELVPLSGMLPQTGLLWWPVAVMAALGTLLLALGLIQRKNS